MFIFFIVGLYSLSLVSVENNRRKYVSVRRQSVAKIHLSLIVFKKELSTLHKYEEDVTVLPLKWTSFWSLQS